MRHKQIDETNALSVNWLCWNIVAMLGGLNSKEIVEFISRGERWPDVIWLGDCDVANPKIRVSFELSIKSRKRSRGRYNPSESSKCLQVFSRIFVVIGFRFITFAVGFDGFDFESVRSR